MIGKTADLCIQGGFPAPFTCGIHSDRSFYSFEAQAGRAAAIILVGRLALPDVVPLAQAFLQRSAVFAQRHSDILMLVDAQSPHLVDFLTNAPQGVRAIYCLPEAFNDWMFDGSKPEVYIMDQGLRLAGYVEAADPATIAEEALARILAMPFERPMESRLPAPVLFIPNLFDMDLCRALIEHFEASPYSEGGMASVGTAGAALHKVDHSKKKRLDFIVSRYDKYYNIVCERLASICVPQMKKAFQADAEQLDRVILARYDAPGGVFRRHRDNASPSVAFRQFALSVNLNDGYDGGHLQFPEFNMHLYRSPCGGGIVFSASLLHEVTPVLRGSRYVLFTFLFNRRAAKLSPSEPAAEAAE